MIEGTDRPASIDLARLLDAARPRDRLILQLLAEVGCRPRDIVRLQKEDLAGTTLLIKAQQVDLPATLAQALAAHAAARPDSLLFSSRPGRPLTIRRVRQIVAQHTRAALGQVLTPRDLRTAAIRQMVRGGAPLERVQAAAGLGRTRAAQLYQAFTPKQEAPPGA